MRVLVDTSIWSLALRRPTSQVTRVERIFVTQLTDLIRENQVLIIGPVRQELLSGLRDEATFARLQNQLASFADDILATEDFELAARCSNRCRASGVASSSVDMLLCAVAVRRAVSVFTADKDFVQYAEILDLKLFEA